ncbi:hypothetical protein [uncultured Limimaricola sp.]|uniref:hypothetical protein n=1 Tax=uncultured Limimaricola sp. TaxID=2211667 RepID=UPI0030F7ECC0
MLLVVSDLLALLEAETTVSWVETGADALLDVLLAAVASAASVAEVVLVVD